MRHCYGTSDFPRLSPVRLQRPYLIRTPWALWQYVLRRSIAMHSILLTRLGASMARALFSHVLSFAGVFTPLEKCTSRGGCTGIRPEFRKDDRKDDD